MSVESGFKTFRGNDGLWENYPVDQVASHEGMEMIMGSAMFTSNFPTGIVPILLSFMGSILVSPFFYSHTQKDRCIYAAVLLGNQVLTGTSSFLRKRSRDRQRWSW